MTELAQRPPHATVDTERRAEGASVRVFSRRFSPPGLVVAMLFMALSLLPSLLPRSPLFQGVVSGITVALGYAMGAAGQWAWTFLELPALHGRARPVVMRTLGGVVAIVAAAAVWQHVGWQNDVRAILGVDPVGPLVWAPIVAVAALVAALLLVVGRSLRAVFNLTAGWLGRRLPRRLALLLGGIAVLVLLNLLYNGVLVSGFFAGANQLFSTSDRGLKEGSSRPVSPLQSGSPESVASWDSLGRQGRSFVSTGPSVDDLNAFSGGGAVEPIRVYAGLRTADTVQGRADVVLEELIRTGAFDREVLVLGTTTGTGFLDPWGVDPLEYLYNGDTAIAGVQYSYLPSWISLLADQAKAGETARVTFETVHRYWSRLPEPVRPELYLYGLSLGSFGAESILTSIDVVNEPIDGALLSGPPFVNGLWNTVVDNREEGTSPWLPVYRGGRTVRFMGEDDAPARSDGTWGPTRIAYLQHATDPVVFFSPDLLFSEPDWLREGQRSPDISDDFIWIPLVTMWQVAFDMAGAGDVPVGYGHLYSPQANGAAWIAVTRPANWSGADTQRFIDFLAETVEDA